MLSVFFMLLFSGQSWASLAADLAVKFILKTNVLKYKIKFIYIRSYQKINLKYLNKENL